MAQIILSAQDFDIYDSDGRDPVARTGSISVEMLDCTGAKGVILGHSDICRSTEKKDLLPYITLLVGESWDEFRGNSVEKVAEIVSQKLFAMLEDIPSHEQNHGYKEKNLQANFKAFNLQDSYEKYIEELKKLDDSFLIYLSPCYTDIRDVCMLLH